MSATDGITEWLSRKGRKTLDVDAARQLAAESPDHWYVASYSDKGFLVGKMTMEKFSQRHILVDGEGRPVLFPTVEHATAFLRSELKIPHPHIFNF